MPGTVARLVCVFAALGFLFVFLTVAEPGPVLPALPEPRGEVVIVGGDFDYPPYEWLDSSGRPRGFHVDLLRAIAKDRGLEIRYRLGPWAEVRRAMENGKIHLLPMFRTPERERLVDFCEPHAILHHVIVVRRGDPVLNSTEELRGRRVLVQNGSFIQDWLGRENVGVIPLIAESEVDVVRLLDSGRADCAVVTQLAAEQTIDDLGLSGRILVGAPVLPREYCIAIRKGDDALRREISLGLSTLREDGRLDEIRRRWFGKGYMPSDLLTYVAWIGFPLLLVGFGGLLWNYSLRSQVNAKTRALALELDCRGKAEEEVRKLNRDLEQRVRDRTLQLENANRELEAFSTSASHDLRAPLRHVAGYIDLLDSRVGGGLDEKSRGYMSTIRRSSEQMLLLIEDLLSFARTARVEMDVHPVDMTALVEGVRAQAASETEGRNVDWRVDALPVVRADASLIRQVWGNLISNALKYTRSRERAVIEIRAESREGAVVFSIRDNGVGFDMKHADRIFKEFERLHSQDAYEGTGVGLALVDRIVRRHGGRAWAEGEPDKGAVFSFTLGAREEGPS